MAAFGNILLSTQTWLLEYAEMYFPEFAAVQRERSPLARCPSHNAGVQYPNFRFETANQDKSSKLPEYSF